MRSIPTVECNEMSSANPYEPTTEVIADDFGIRKVSVQPIQLIKRGYRMLADQYWMFLGITFVGLIVGSAVPFGIILGPMLVGIYLCYVQREQGQHVEFGTLFRGFDYFVESFLAFLILFVVSLTVMIPFMIAFFVIVFLPMIAAANAPNAPPPQLPASIFIWYPLMIIANVAITLPFLFTFQLIADRKLKAIPAVKLSARGVIKNLGGILWFMFFFMIISIILTMMCYFPVFLFMPISFASLFILYRDIFGPAVHDAQLVNGG